MSDGLFGGISAYARSLCSVVRFGLFLSAVLFTTWGRAADITWGGEYRVEAVKIKNADLANGANTGYLLHHLILSPKIVAADGLTIYSRFDILNNATFGQNNQAGEVFGVGPNNGSATQTPDNRSNAWSMTGASGQLAINELYLTWTQEFGQLVVGRVPLQFGLGISYSAGNGLFDKYFTTRDLVGYKIVMGNIFFLPMIAKVSETAVVPNGTNPPTSMPRLGTDDDVNDYMMQVEYDNPESESSAGVLYRMRVGSGYGNDSLINYGQNDGAGGPNDGIGGPGATLGSGMKLTQWSLYGSQRYADFKLSLEAALTSGKTGVYTAGGTEVDMNGFAIAGELAYQPKNSKFDGVLKMGLASGDDPASYEHYEGFIFNRNYDVALLMFNHPLGQINALRTGLVRDTLTPASQQIDTEAISNAFYFAPSVEYRFRENMAFGGAFIYGMLVETPVVGTSGSKSLGEEVDFSFTYKPYQRLTWISELGLLAPGAGWSGGGQFSTGFAYGLSTKAAISF